MELTFEPATAPAPTDYTYKSLGCWLLSQVPVEREAWRRKCESERGWLAGTGSGGSDKPAGK